MLGRILPEFFPKIFGQSEDQPLDGDAAQQALKHLADDINQHAQPDQGKKTVDEVWLTPEHLCSELNPNAIELRPVPVHVYHNFVLLALIVHIPDSCLLHKDCQTRRSQKDGAGC